LLICMLLGIYFQYLPQAMQQFVSDLRQVGGFPPGIPFTSTNKTDPHDITAILLKVELNTIIVSLQHLIEMCIIRV